MLVIFFAEKYHIGFHCYCNARSFRSLALFISLVVAKIHIGYTVLVLDAPHGRV